MPPQPCAGPGGEGVPAPLCLGAVARGSRINLPWGWRVLPRTGWGASSDPIDASAPEQREGLRPQHALSPTPGFQGKEAGLQVGLPNSAVRYQPGLRGTLRRGCMAIWNTLDSAPHGWSTPATLGYTGVLGGGSDREVCEVCKGGCVSQADLSWTPRSPQLALGVTLAPASRLRPPTGPGMGSCPSRDGNCEERQAWAKGPVCGLKGLRGHRGQAVLTLGLRA